MANGCEIKVNATDKKMKWRRRSSQNRCN